MQLREGFLLSFWDGIVRAHIRVWFEVSEMATVEREMREGMFGKNKVKITKRRIELRLLEREAMGIIIFMICGF